MGSVIVINTATPASQPAPPNMPPQNYSHVKSKDGFFKQHGRKKQSNHSFFTTIGVLATGIGLALGTVMAFHSPKIAAEVLQKHKWQNLKSEEIGPKCEEFSKNNQHFESNIRKLSLLPNKAKAFIFSIPGQFWAKVSQHFDANSPLRQLCEHRSNEYKLSAERLKNGHAKIEQHNSATISNSSEKLENEGQTLTSHSEVKQQTESSNQQSKSQKPSQALLPGPYAKGKTHQNFYGSNYHQAGPIITGRPPKRLAELPESTQQIADQHTPNSYQIYHQGTPVAELPISPAELPELPFPHKSISTSSSGYHADIDSPDYTPISTHSSSLGRSTPSASSVATEDINTPEQISSELGSIHDQTPTHSSVSQHEKESNRISGLNDEEGFSTSQSSTHHTPNSTASQLDEPSYNIKLNFGEDSLSNSSNHFTPSRSNPPHNHSLNNRSSILEEEEASSNSLAQHTPTESSASINSSGTQFEAQKEELELGGWIMPTVDAASHLKPYSENVEHSIDFETLETDHTSSLGSQRWNTISSGELSDTHEYNFVTDNELSSSSKNTSNISRKSTQ
jgi:hypothetical protein